MSADNTNHEKMLRETEAMLRAVLISSPRGVHFEKLQRDYKELTFKTIPYKELGYPNLETFLQNIPAVARVEKGPDGEWMVKGVASDADKHVAKLISKQKKPSLRKSAKSMIARRRATPSPMRINTPVRKPAPRPHSSKPSSTYQTPPRFLKMMNEDNRNKAPRPGQGNVKMGKGKENSVAKPRVSVGRGEMFKKATDGIKTSRNNEMQRKPSSSSKETSKLSVSISSTSQGRSVTAVTPKQPMASGILDDPASVEFIKSEILKVQSGLWGSRLEHLYREKFKKVLPSTFMQELKFRPDITRVDEIMQGRFLLYAPKKQQPVKIATDFSLLCDLPNVGTSIIVYISHTENPSCFFVSREDAISEKISEAIRKHYKTSTYSSTAIPSVSPGQIFCAKFTDDDNFYRACVLEVIDSKRIRVQYVDFGNKEIIPVDRLRVLISEFQKQAIQAYECYLDGVQPADQASEWNDAAINKFDEFTSEKELRMTVHQVDGKILSVSLVDVQSELDVAEELKKTGLAVSSKNLESSPSSSSSSLSSSSGVTTPKPENVASRSRRLKSKSPGIVEIPDEQFIDVFVCNIIGTYNVFLRLIGEEYSTKFEAIQESMTSYYSDSKDEVTGEPAVGDLFALLSDEVWCRVKVTGVNGGKMQVFFVDHGDETETTKAELRPLADQFRKLPFQVFHCALNGLPKTKKPDVVDKLKKLIMCEEAVAEVIKRTGDLVFIELLDTRTDVSISVNNVIRKLVIPDEELKPVLPKVGKIVDVDIAYISPTGSVFLHVSAAGSKRLEELNRDLTEHYTSKRSKASEFVSKPTPGKVFCAKCEDDGNWYRAKILACTDNGIEVVYVDYGNTEVLPVTNLREPTQENAHVMSLPFQALECQLYDVPKDDWSDDMVDRIFEYVDHGSLSAEVLSNENPPSVSLLVTVESEGKQVTQRLSWCLGYSGNEYEDDDYQVVPETDPENVDGEAGKALLNGGKAVTNVESESAREQRNVESNNAEAAKKYEEKPPATEQTSVSKVEDKAPFMKVIEKRGKDVDEGSVNEVKENDALINEFVATNHSQWKALALQSDWFDVYITDVKDPDNFTFQLWDNDPEITKLLDEMNSYYQNQVVENEVTLVEGNVYAVLYEQDDCWYRSVVESIISGDKAYVRFLDYGGYVTVEKEDVRVLDEKFLQLPFQGVPAKLAGIKCTKKRWSKESMKNFKYLTHERYLVAKTTNGHKECNCYSLSAVTVELCDTEDPTKDVYIAKKFIEENSDVVPA